MIALQKALTIDNIAKSGKKIRTYSKSEYLRAEP